LHYRSRKRFHGLNTANLPAEETSARGGRFWLLTLAAILVIAGTASLGRWQLSRAAQKEAIQARIDAQQSQPALDAPAFLALADASVALYRPVRLRGLWLGPHTVYLDNRPMHGIAGFDVLTPFAIEGSDQTVMVQRGWIQRNFEDRTKLQPIETPTGLVEITARIAPPPGHLLELGKAESGAAMPGGVEASPIRQNLDLGTYRSETGLPLRTDVSLQQIGVPSEGLRRDWPVPASGIEKHYGYAFQWFAMSVLVIILYVWFQFIAPYRRARRARPR
jgi:cytochrome oxidase assembly protein ShyY1